MATTQRGDTTSSSGLDRLMEELGGYVSAQAEHLADKAVDKVGDVTDTLLDVAESGGTLPDIGARILKGDSPVKAALGGVKDKLKDVGSNLLGGGKGKGRKSGSKSMNIIESIDVGVPLRTAYDHWTQYEDFSSFTKGVRSVSQGDDTSSDWKVKVGPSTRSWKATVQEQIPDERIVWTSEGAKGTTRGCVSFHELAPALTRIVLVVEYYPAGLFEKTGNIWRAQGRRMRLDLKNFSRYVTLGNDEAEGWRGEIQDGEVVVTHEEALEAEEAEEEDSAAEEPGEEMEEGAEEGGQDQDEEDYPEDEDEEYPEGEEEDEDEAYGEEEAAYEDADQEQDEDAEDEEEAAYEDADQEQDEDAEDEEEEEPRRTRRRR
ncbi:SRPBCC family protein [Streptomyces sp. NBC_01276]|uniref:SRPBCC family protein n=1 Tax=Streptomyces sp. NBC_01276 TaxID=2903808 RepID=UPI00352DDA98